MTAGDNSGLAVEWLRINDLATRFGIRRGTAYNLLRDGKIKGCVLRVRGKQTGVRLIHAQSVRDYIESQVEREQEAVVVE